MQPGTAFTQYRRWCLVDGDACGYVHRLVFRFTWITSRCCLQEPVAEEIPGEVYCSAAPDELKDAAARLVNMYNTQRQDDVRNVAAGAMQVGSDQVCIVCPGHGGCCSWPSVHLWVRNTCMLCSLCNSWPANCLFKAQQSDEAMGVWMPCV
jgi:hypothetical protein